ncbi:MAG TPA: ABC transporter substrate-binding protein [Solirubrobacteraceae bacterium]|nr:ABC transporter substrate-binding protein [Solirubrobacteraceae bacterium]
MVAALLVPAAAVAGGGSSPTASASAAQINLRVAYVPSLQAMPVFVADKKGLFTRNGLKVKLTGSPNLGTFAPALNRQYDIVFASSVDAIVAAGRGLNVVAFSGLSMETTKAKGLHLILGKDSGLTSASQLKGKTIGVPTLSGTLYVSTLAALLRAGVNPKDVTFREVPFPQQLDQLNAGRIDATAVAEPFAAQQRAAGNKSLGDPFLAVASPARSTMWITNKGWAAKNADAIARWRKTMGEAIAYIRAHPAEVRTIFEKALKLPAGATSHSPLPSFQTKLTAAQLRPWVTALDTTKVLPKSKAPDVNTMILK